MKKVTIEYEGYTFDELDESAKDRVRSWYAESAIYCEWYDTVYDNFLEICKILGIETTSKKIYFSGFWSQGDGAMFEGGYSYKPGSVKAIMEYAPQDTELHGIAKTLQAIQRPYFYSLGASIKQHGHYYHSNSNIITVDNCYTYQDVSRKTEDDLSEALRDLMNWLYKTLETEYEYLTSDEQIKESAKANGWLFKKSGKLIY